jgi:hypothetical protein
MGRRTIINAAATILLLLASAVLASAQDFQKSYNLEPGATISVANVSGDIHIIGYDGTAVTVAGYKEGRDRDMVEVEDKSGGGRVELGVKYPRECNCDASIRFEVRVPRSVNYNFDRISTASGNLSAEGVTGRIELHTASGEVTVQGVSGEVRAASASGSVKVRDAAGTVSASSASGNVDVELARLDGAGDMRFTSASGDVNVRMPSSLDARVDMSTASGSIETDFPIEVKKDRYSSGYTARGQLGSGSRSLKISSASGDVKLKSL